MQEEVENKTVLLAIKTTKLMLKPLITALNKYLEEERKGVLLPGKGDSEIKGKQTVKELIGKGDGVSSVNIEDEGLRDFKKAARKYGLDYAVVKDKTGESEKYIVFFKLKDKEAIEKVTSLYAAKRLSVFKGKTRESIIGKLNKFKEIAKMHPKKVHEKRKEIER